MISGQTVTDISSTRHRSTLVFVAFRLKPEATVVTSDPPHMANERSGCGAFGSLAAALSAHTRPPTRRSHARPNKQVVKKRGIPAKDPLQRSSRWILRTIRSNHRGLRPICVLTLNMIFDR